MKKENEIYYAIVFNEVDELKVLVTSKNVNDKIKDGYPLHYAVIKNNEYITKYLLEIGANSNLRFEDGATPLIIASENGEAGICLLLLQNGALVNEVDDYGNDALVKAVLYGRTEIVNLLLQFGADPYNKRVIGKTAIDLAAEMKLTELSKLLTIKPLK